MVNANKGKLNVKMCDFRYRKWNFNKFQMESDRLLLGIMFDEL